MDDLIKAHDELLENAPADFDLAKHKTECPVCNPTVLNEPDARGEVDKTFTQEQLDAAVEAALAPIRDELKAFKDAEAAGEVDSKIAAAKAEAESKLAEVQDKLDAAELKATNAEQLLADSLAWIQAVVDEQDTAEKAEAVKESRIAVLKEKTSFSDEKIAERIGDWAQLSDEAFADRLVEWEELSTAKTGTEDASRETAMRTLRKDAGKNISFIESIRTVTEQAEAAGINLKSL